MVREQKGDNDNCSMTESEEQEQLQDVHEADVMHTIFKTMANHT